MIQNVTGWYFFPFLLSVGKIRYIFGEKDPDAAKIKKQNKTKTKTAKIQRYPTANKPWTQAYHASWVLLKEELERMKKWLPII